MAKDTNWDSPVSKRWIQINSDSWIWLSDIMSLVKYRKGRPHVTQINTGSTCQQKSYRDGVQPKGACGGPVAARGLPLSWAGWSCGEQTFRTALVNMPMVSTHPELCLCPFQLNVLGATKLTSDGLLLICSGGIRDWDAGFLSQYINVWAIFTVSMGIIYSLDTMTLIFFCSFLCSYILYRKKIILSLRQNLYHYARFNKIKIILTEHGMTNKVLFMAR